MVWNNQDLGKPLEELPLGPILRKKKKSEKCIIVRMTSLTYVCCTVVIDWGRCKIELTSNNVSNIDIDTILNIVNTVVSM
jgi:hypothetical protein